MKITLLKKPIFTLTVLIIAAMTRSIGTSSAYGACEKPLERSFAEAYATYEKLGDRVQAFVARVNEQGKKLHGEEPFAWASIRTGSFEVHWEVEVQYLDLQELNLLDEWTLVRAEWARMNILDSKPAETLERIKPLRKDAHYHLAKRSAELSMLVNAVEASNPADVYRILAHFEKQRAQYSTLNQAEKDLYRRSFSEGFELAQFQAQAGYQRKILRPTRMKNDAEMSGMEFRMIGSLQMVDDEKRRAVVASLQQQEHPLWPGRNDFPSLIVEGQLQFNEKQQQQLIPHRPVAGIHYDRPVRDDYGQLTTRWTLVANRKNLISNHLYDFSLVFLK